MGKYNKATPFDLRRERFFLLKEQSNLEEEMDKRRSQNRHIMKLEDQKWTTEGFGVKLTGAIQGSGCYIVGPELGFNIHNITATLLELPPGSEEGKYHTHGEAVKYYLKGEATELVGDKVYQVKQGDAVLIPANTWHGTQNKGSEPVRMLAMGHSLVPLVEEVIQGSIDDDGQEEEVPPEARVGRGEFPQKELSGLDPRQLYSRRKALIREKSRLEEELNRRRSQDRHVMKVEEQEWTEEGFGLKLRGQSGRGATLIAPELGFNIHNMTVTMLEVPPGSKEGLYHTHGEAIKYYLKGQAIELIGDNKYEVKAGDAAFIPAGMWHGTENIGTEPVVIIAVAHSIAPLMKHHILGSIDDVDGQYIPG